MVATLERTEAVEPDLTNDVALPGEVLRVLTAGRQELQAVRQQEEAEARAKREREDVAWARCFNPLLVAVAKLIPADLIPFADFQEKVWRKQHFNPTFPDTVMDSGWTGAQVELRCPGCDTVSLPFQRSYGQPLADQPLAAGGWQPWQLYLGFHAHPWLPDQKRLGQSVAYPTLALALAVAREAWLARHQDERDNPL